MKNLIVDEPYKSTGGCQDRWNWNRQTMESAE